MRNTNLIAVLGALVLGAGCGPAGVISGQVSVEGGSAGDVVVVAFGPASAATVTRADGTFSISSLPDGAYVVRGTVRGAEVEEVSVATTITNGAAAPAPQLSFRMANSRVTGRVTMADGSSAGDIAVTAVGAVTRTARTAMDGAFALEGLIAGPYLVTAEARDTREGRVSVSVNAGGAADVGELRLTPVGRLAGTVTFNSAPAVGATVAVAGTPLSSVTDAAGKFELTQVPTGAQVVTATGPGPIFRGVSQMVTVSRGANADLTLALADVPPRTGTVTGVVTFRGSRSPRDITVTVGGTGLTATPAANGAFSLQVPVGAWDIIASAPYHPALTLGRVLIAEGQTVALPGQELSFYRPVWQSNSPLAGVGGSLHVDDHPWVLVTVADSYNRLALYNVKTFEFRLLGVGVSTSAARLSKTARYVGWSIGTSAFVYDTTSGVTLAFPSPFSSGTTATVNQVEFSSDESTVFIVRNGPTLTRVALANPTSLTTFPAAGSASGLMMQSADRWFVREGTDARLVTPTTDVAQIFTNITSMEVIPTAWALTNCAPSTLTNCTLRLLAPTSTTPATVTAVSPAAGTFTEFRMGYGYDDSAAHPCFVSGSTAFCADSATGSHYPLPAIPSSFKLNVTASRVIYVFTQGATVNLREHAMPPPASATNLTSASSGTWNTAWLSPTRAVAIPTTGSPRTLQDIKSGVASTDPDVGTQTAQFNGALVVFPKASTSQWQAILGDGPTRNLNVITSRGVNATSSRFFTSASDVPRYSTASFDATSSHVIDESTGTAGVRVNPNLRCSAALRSGSLELCLGNRTNFLPGINLHGTDSLVEIADPSLSTFGFLGSQSAGVGVLGLSIDGRTVLGASLAP